uniref:Uncharacterized protein n=1 Tax=Anguilla anguilla TaxID=7936 RepID=A0A0E9XDV6_ANGAN
MSGLTYALLEICLSANACRQNTAVVITGTIL